MRTDVGFDDIVDEFDIGRAAIGADRRADRIDGRLDFIQQRGQVAEFHAVASALDGAALVAREAIGYDVNLVTQVLIRLCRDRSGWKRTGGRRAFHEPPPAGRGACRSDA